MYYAPETVFQFCELQLFFSCIWCLVRFKDGNWYSASGFTQIGLLYINIALILCVCVLYVAGRCHVILLNVKQELTPRKQSHTHTHKPLLRPC